ncbi:MAG TPA: signal peptidase II [Actinomycetota bacterium]|nr:signal peptidase II [Actinomycetota bacterium]
MTPTGTKGGAVLFAAAGGAYLLDRLTKAWVEGSLQGRPPIHVIDGVLDLRYTTNSGGAFSLGQSTPWLFAAATIAVSIAIVVTAFRHTSLLTAAALGLVLGGALGNLTDRIVRGSGLGLDGRVIDFIDFHVWPVFNAADSSIVIGAAMLALTAFWRRVDG